MLCSGPRFGVTGLGIAAVTAHDPFGLTSATALLRGTTREGRIQMLAEVAEDLAAGRIPDRDAARWLGSSLYAWLVSSRPAKRADLVRDFLEVAAEPRSKATPQRVLASIWRQKAKAQASSDDPASQSIEPS